ncbi:MAG: DUF308 domain-containing protein [Muribaculaceae bacterium]|nr:hypothetical protein [Bacteroidales bacterium]MBD5327646.1 hypothetical protein [Bacteroides sp.]MBD5415726.1 hypothetical protein [Bacteroides sp.]MDE6223615.1 DUF308 domain-containing protein [Muribaculaceae bacterium]MDE6228659.1 DUF308 domain-containing protein [Muribaculaceae bacterium]
MDNSYKGSLYSAILALIVGIFMVAYSNVTLRTIVLVVGIMFIATAVFNLCYEFSRKRAANKSTSMPSIIASFGAGVLGIIMVLTPIGMVNLIVYLFATAIILLGLYEILAMAFMYRPVTFPFWFFILPSLMVICGVVICIMGAEQVGEVAIIVTGVALIVYAASTFLNIIGLVTYRRKLRQAQAAPESHEEAPAEHAVEDVKAVEAESSTPDNN